VPDVFDALADPTRRLILDELVDRDGQALFELCTRLITRHQVAITRQGLSHHVKVLEEAGLLHVRREGRTKLHFLRTKQLEAIGRRWTTPGDRRADMLKINITSVFVDDQDKALAFYTDKLGFLPKNDVPTGEHRWLTVVSPAEPDGVELLLEPDAHEAAKAYSKALAEDGIPATSFAVDDVDAAYAELTAKGVTFVQPPTPMGPVTTAVLDDTCGNLIMIAGPNPEAS
jgi:DNA-binding transcriptional ArsR family regulator